MTVLLLAILVISLAEGIPLYKKGQKKELVFMFFLLGTAIVLKVMEWFGLPSPVVMLDRLVSPVGKAIFK
ncbi:MAG TPA: hypothetical protein VHQ46_01085 [Desulfobacteria bacterium]|nr:hypothetical protein [Desulfobacteria bacterium]